MMLRYLHTELWEGCVGAWCPSYDLFRGSTQLTDHSPFRNHGTLTNMDAATDWIWSPGGGGGYALDFDGVNDKVNLGSSVARSLILPLSVSYWVYHRTVGSLKGHFCANQGGNTQFTMRLQGSPVKLRLEIDDNAIDSATTIVAGNWIHIAATVTSVSRNLWLNGVSDSSSTGTYTCTDRGYVVNLGFDYTNSRVLDGQMDDIRVYNRVLSPSEIWTLSRRRGIAYELDYGFDAFGSAAAPPSGNLARLRTGWLWTKYQRKSEAR